MGLAIASVMLGIVAGIVAVVAGASVAVAVGALYVVANGAIVGAIAIHTIRARHASN